MLPLWLQHRAVCINNTQKPPEKGGFFGFACALVSKIRKRIFLPFALCTNLQALLILLIFDKKSTDND